MNLTSININMAPYPDILCSNDNWLKSLAVIFIILLITSFAQNVYAYLRLAPSFWTKDLLVCTLTSYTQL